MKLSADAVAVLEELRRAHVAVTREVLRASSGIGSDRELRDAIAELAENGFLIVPGKRGKGYELTEDPERVRKELATLQAYDRSFHRRMNGLTKGLSRLLATPQEALFDA